MKARNIITSVLFLLLTVGAITSTYLTRDRWYPLLFDAQADQGHGHGHGHSHGGHAHGGHAHGGHAHGNPNQIELSPQALKTMKLVVKKMELRTAEQPYWRSIQIPGKIVERPGRSDHKVTAPLPGVVSEVVAVPGEVVEPGQKLFTIRVISEHLQASQRELYQIIREKEINQQERRRLEEVAGGAIPKVKLLELDYEQKRLQAKEMSYRYELGTRGLTQEQIEGITRGDFIREIAISAPNEPLGRHDPSALTTRKGGPRADQKPLFDVETLKIHPGDQVTVGEALCTLSEHQVLYLEGRVFLDEVPLIREAMRNEWPVKLALATKEKGDWGEPPTGLQILFIGNQVDQKSQTVPAYIPIPNQYEERKENGKRFRTWRFRTSQRVLIEVPVGRFENVFVLPSEAVVREGAEHYVFEQNGNAFDRTEVEVLYRDRENVVIAHDGSLVPGFSSVAQNGAAQLHRALQIQSGSGNIDPHAGHMH